MKRKMVQMNETKGKIQLNLCTTTTLRTQNLWPLLAGGRCSEVALCNNNWNWDPKIVVVVDKWSLTQIWLYSSDNFFFFIWRNNDDKKYRFIKM